MKEIQKILEYIDSCGFRPPTFKGIVRGLGLNNEHSLARTLDECDQIDTEYNDCGEICYKRKKSYQQAISAPSQDVFTTKTKVSEFINVWPVSAKPRAERVIRIKRNTKPKKTLPPRKIKEEDKRINRAFPADMKILEILKKRKIMCVEEFDFIGCGSRKFVEARVDRGILGKISFGSGKASVYFIAGENISMQDAEAYSRKIRSSAWPAQLAIAA